MANILRNVRLFTGGADLTGANNKIEFGVEVEDGCIREWRLEADALGQETVELGALAGGDAVVNAAMLERLLDGEPGPRREAVLLNAAAALVVEGRARDVADGYERARTAIDSGDAARRFEGLRAATRAA